MAKKVARILSIDGGGIRGIIPGTILSLLEDRVGPIANKFHMIAGTSTGGILGCGLVNPGKILSAKQLVDFYIKEGPLIFAAKSGSLGGVGSEMYDAEILEQILKTLLTGNISQVSAADLIITSYDIERRNPQFFKSWKARGTLALKSESPTYDFPMWTVGRCTSAAPTYFSPAKIQNLAGDEFALVDGGVYANNPAMCAYVAARQLYPNADEYLIVSLGTGEVKVPYMYDDAVSWGLIGWARPLLDIMFAGVSDTVSYELDQLKPGVSHYRFQTELSTASDAMDDVSPQNLKALVADANTTLVKNSIAMGKIVGLLNEPMVTRQELGYPGEQASGSIISKVISIPKGKPAPVGGMAIGATTGAALGLAFGPIGALVGAGLGALGIKLVPEK